MHHDNWLLLVIRRVPQHDYQATTEFSPSPLSLRPCTYNAKRAMDRTSWPLWLTLIIDDANCRRGIDVVRNRIKMFAHQKVTLPRGRHKVIILDEADR